MLLSFDHSSNLADQIVCLLLALLRQIENHRIVLAELDRQIPW